MPIGPSEKKKKINRKYYSLFFMGLGEGQK